MDQKSVHDYFIKWRTELSKCSYMEKKLAHKKIGDIIEATLWNSDIFDAADRIRPTDEDFDKVALSVKLLISLLHSISEDTFSSKVMGSGLYGYYLDSWMPYVLDILRGEHDSTNDQSLLQTGKGQARRYLAKQPKMFVPLPPGDKLGGRAARLLLTLLIDIGWCPSRSRQLCQSYDYLTVNNLASLRDCATSAEIHGNCMKSEKGCTHRLGVNPPFPHVPNDVNCRMGKDLKENIVDIIKCGGIPLISMSLDKDDPGIKVVQCTPYITYTAVSHVWSDGLGSHGSNALPLCQLVMISRTYSLEHSPFYDGRTTLSRFNSRISWYNWKLLRPGKPYVSTSDKRLYFWMDTLCIPVGHKDLKLRAIRHITPIYAGAFNILVLDK